ncbi:hypothetical protein E3N88_40030 [Mikania micrantha]|uniref:Integrase catalytic domain-containing protein n=1 Tax=Mikania micrantha TaxID=192012 RepID=A0A5N6LLF8_9ASTR|nr:hypothetical protein E3N88_40030 [Mikania micrantha]
MANSTTVIHLSTTTNFPIKLTTNNFPSWRKQVLSTLTGLALEQFVDGLTEPPPKVLDGKPNPEYRTWYRQDQVLLGALLGSCSDHIQPIVSSAETSRQLFIRLTESYASVSRSRIISLRTKLTTTTKGSRPVADYLHEMKAIADELALAQKPIDDDDLTVHILAHLGDDYKAIAAALKTWDTTIAFSDLYEKLVDHERSLLEAKPVEPIIKVNNTQRATNTHASRHFTRPASVARNQNRHNTFSPRSTNIENSGKISNFRTNRNNYFCNFCNIPGHETKDCRKFARFLQQNNLALTPASTNPTVNVSMTNSPQHASWPMFDSGASNHATSDQASMHNLSEYGGPDEIVLGNGIALPISHIGQASIPTSSRPLTLSNVLLVPRFAQSSHLIEKFFKTSLVSLFSDNGGEYIGLIPYLQQHGISHFTTPPHTPEQNGVAERRHRHIVETGLSLLHHAHLPLAFWSHAFQTAVHLINRLPTKILDFKSPFEKLYNTPPTYTKLKSFGCLCFPWLRPYAKSKIHPRSTKCIFLGYSSSKSAYKCYDPVTHRLYHSRHVEFIDHIFPFTINGLPPDPLPIPNTFLHTSTQPPPEPTSSLTAQHPHPSPASSITHNLIHALHN